MGDVLLLSDHFVNIRVVVATVGAEVLLALGPLYKDADDKLGGTPLVMLVSARDING